MNATRLKQLIAKVQSDSCTKEDRELIAEALDELLQYEGDIDDLKSGFGYLHAKVKGIEKD